jgi:hypothetical protein
MSLVKVTGLAAGFAGVCALAVAVESAPHTMTADETADTMESFIITASAVTSGRTSWRK